MCECSRCKKSFEEYDLTWVESPRIYHMQIKRKLEVVCDNCLKKEKLDKDDE